jgi:hypothetical protein
MGNGARKNMNYGASAAMGRSSLQGFRMRGNGIVQRKDGSIAVIRPGFRPRVLSREEVEALKEEARVKRELDENPFATMTNPPRIGGSHA